MRVLVSSLCVCASGLNSFLICAYLPFCALFQRVHACACVIFVCLCVLLRVCICLCVHVCVFACSCTCACVLGRLCPFACFLVYMFACAGVFVCVCVRNVNQCMCAPLGIWIHHQLLGQPQGLYMQTPSRPRSSALHKICSSVPMDSFTYFAHLSVAFLVQPCRVVSSASSSSSV